MADAEVQSSHCAGASSSFILPPSSFQMNPATTVTFTGNGSVTLRATAPDTDAPTTVPGVVYRTQGGSVVSYQVGPQYWEATLVCQGLTDAQQAALVAFFAANFTMPFTYLDENGNSFTARFLEPTLPLRKGYRDSWDVAIRLNLSSALV
jgi:hypothetical protein